MQKKRSIKIISVVLILMLICVSITYVKSGNKEVLATTKEFNTESLQDNEHMHVELDSSGDKIPVPNGYVGSKATGENEIDTGYVIYEGEEEVNDSNVEEAQKTRNQYVWIPVPDVTTMYGTDENGKKWGKLYDFTMATGDNIDPVTGAKPLNWSEENGIMRIINKSSNLEPEIGTNFQNKISIDTESKLHLYENQLKISTAHEFLNKLEKEFNSMIESVEEYGGFYIGRYETGNISKNKAVIKKGNNNIGGQTWYTKYIKCKELKYMDDALTGMIWGCQWDRTLMWLIETGNKTKGDICNNSVSWGNYVDSTFEYINTDGTLSIKEAENSKLIPTGSSEYTKANNIYDLSGNIRDLTMEELTNFCRIYRGGDYWSYGSYSAKGRFNGGGPSVSNVFMRLPSNVIYKVKQKIANNFKKRNY